MAGRPPCLPSAPEMTLSLEKPGERPQDPGLPLMGDHRVFGTSGVSHAFPRHQALFARPNHSVFGEASKSLYALIKPPENWQGSPRIHMLWVLLPPSGEGEGAEGRGSCLSSLGGLVLQAFHIRGFSAAHRDEGASAWASPHRIVAGCVSRVESHSFFAPPLSPVVSPPCFELHHPLMTGSRVSWAPPVCWASGPYRGHLI